MSTMTAERPLRSVPTIGETKEQFADVLTAKSAVLASKAQDLITFLDSQTTAAAERLHVGGPLRYAKAAIMWVARKLSFLRAPLDWVGSRNVAGLMLTSETGQALIASVARTVTWPIRRAYSLLVFEVPAFVMARKDGTRLSNAYATYQQRVIAIEKKIELWYLIARTGLQSVIGPERIWMRVAKRYFGFRMIINLGRRFVPYAWLRFAVSAIYGLLASANTARDLGVLNRTSEEVAEEATEKVAATADQAQQRAETAAAAATNAVAPPKPGNQGQPAKAAAGKPNQGHHRS